MKVILNNNTTPQFNLALEEYLLLNKTDGDIVVLWRNDKSVIIGNNQNAFEEINIDYVKKEGISVVRRLTGGGAVFHDLGNVNFTFITDYKEGDFGNYKKLAAPICEFLKSLGLNAEVSGRNDIMAGNAKISGNAQCVKKNRILSHGTLLYSADLTKLKNALNPNKLKLESKGIKSVKSRVCNINELVSISLSAEEFLNELYAFFVNSKSAQPYALTKEDIDETNKLCSRKYASWEHNFALSPKFTLTNSKRFDCGIVEINLNIENAVIKDVKINGDFFGIKDIADLESRLVGVRYQKEDVEKALKPLTISDYIFSLTVSDFLSLMF